jgi:hypothetical protein
VLLFLDILSRGIRRSSVFTSTNPFTNLYIIVNLAIFIRSSSDFQLRSSIMELTDDVWWWLLVTYLAALRCTISSLCLLFWWYGSQTEMACSTVGLTSDSHHFNILYVLIWGRFDLGPILFGADLTCYPTATGTTGACFEWFLSLDWQLKKMQQLVSRGIKIIPNKPPVLI